MYTPELPPVCSAESRANPPFSPTLIKIPGLKPSSNFFSTCAVRPCLSCFFPILSIRGSLQVKNGNETWLLNLYPLLASNHGNAVHTLHHWLSQRSHAARCCSRSADLQSTCIFYVKLDFVFFNYTTKPQVVLKTVMANEWPI